jgi:dihydroorotate dehydrogenase (fumarate)
MNMDISATFMGIKLKNPIIVGASNIVTDPENLKRIEKAGAAAIVYKSLFEEQIQLENLEMDESMAEYNERNAEMINLFPDVEHAGPKEHLYNLKKAKESVDIPIFANLNAVYEETWVDYAKEIENTGVDGIELNFYATPSDEQIDGKSIEDMQVGILKKIKEAVDIPLVVKLSPFYANPLNVIHKMDKAGAAGFVLFNSLFQPDIDVDNEKQTYPYNLSCSSDNRLPLRYAGLLYANINAQICSSTGIFDGKDVIKMILAGADTVQVVSTIYKNKIEHISTMLEDIESWMKENNYNSLQEFKGKLSKKNSSDYYAYRRAQYIDILMKTSEQFKKFPMV